MRKTLDQLLSKIGVSSQALEQARQRQTEKGGSLRENLIALGEFTEETFSQQVSQQLRVPYISLEKKTIADEVLKLLSREKAEKYLALPIELDERHRRLAVTMADPTDMSTIDELKFVVGFTVIPHFTPEDELLEQIRRDYSHLDDKEAVAAAWAIQAGVSEEQQNRGVIDVTILSEADMPLSRFIGQIFSVAYTRGAHEVFIGPSALKLFIPGKGYQKVDFAPKFMQPVIARLKRLLGIEVGEQACSYHQGYTTLKLQNKKEIDLSYLVYTGGHGEEMLLKFKDQTQLPFFEDFLLEPQALQALQSALQQPYGCVLVTGTARSGITTTLYTCLQTVNAPHLNVVSIEAPVECRLDGVLQGQLMPQQNETYTQYLAYAQAQRPDVLMIDSIVGPDMAPRALSLSSGMLVVSSFLAVDTASAVMKLMCMSQPDVVAERLNCITSQRLVRRVCPVCKEKVPLAKAYREKLGLSSDDECYAGKGCEECEYTGYQGVLPLFEVMPFTDEMRRSVLESRHAKNLRHRLAEQGQISLREDGMRKVKQGLTTVQEVLKATML